MRYAGGIAEVQVTRAQAPFVLPALLTQFRSRLEEALLQELLALQAAAAMEEGTVSPAQVVVDTFPSEQGSQRVKDAATLYKAKKSPPAYRTDRGAVSDPGDVPEDAGPATAPGAG